MIFATYFTFVLFLVIVNGEDDVPNLLNNAMDNEDSFPDMIDVANLTGNFPDMIDVANLTGDFPDMGGVANLTGNFPDMDEVANLTGNSANVTDTFVTKQGFVVNVKEFRSHFTFGNDTFIFNTADSQYDQSELPEEFDARKAWPGCRQIIENIANQMFTQTCLYFIIAHVLSDRFCIETKGRVMVSLSAWDFITCCPDREDIFKFLWETGITTGGSYRDADPGCRPFEMEHCSRESIKSPHNNFPPSCLKGDRSTEICMLACAARISTACSAECTQKQDKPLKFFTKGSRTQINYGFPVIYGTNIEEVMMREIMKNGPILSTMNYTLNNYTGGIIQDVQDTFEEGWHGVRITGWGVENRTRYWIAANSYGRKHGEDGWIRIERGRNLMGIESHVFAPRPDLERIPDSVKKSGLRMNLTSVERKEPHFDKPALDSLGRIVELLD